MYTTRQTKYKLMCIPATSVPCERVFSASGLVISYERGRLSPRLTEAREVLRQHKYFKFTILN